jgi:hypothetical protein
MPTVAKMWRKFLGFPELSQGFVINPRRLQLGWLFTACQAGQNRLGQGGKSLGPGQNFPGIFHPNRLFFARFTGLLSACTLDAPPDYP